MCVCLELYTGMTIYFIKISQIPIILEYNVKKNAKNVWIYFNCDGRTHSKVPKLSINTKIDATYQNRDDKWFRDDYTVIGNWCWLEFESETVIVIVIEFNSIQNAANSIQSMDKGIWNDNLFEINDFPIYQINCTKQLLRGSQIP